MNAELLEHLELMTWCRLEIRPDSLLHDRQTDVFKGRGRMMMTLVQIAIVTRGEEGAVLAILPRSPASLPVPSHASPHRARRQDPSTP